MTKFEMYVELQSAIQYNEAGQDDLADESVRAVMDALWYELSESEKTLTGARYRELELSLQSDADNS